MISKLTIKRIAELQLRFLLVRNSSSTINIEKLEKESASEVDVYDEESAKREEEIQRKRNKSRLYDKDRRFLHEENPYPDGPQFWTHGTLKYNRRLYGRYGKASGVDPAICWPTKQELADTKEYESVAYPFTIPQMMEDSHRKRVEKEERVSKRQQEIVEKAKKLDGWVRDMQNRIAKKEAEVTAAKARKDRLIEEVRAHFGYTVDPRDEKFQQLLEKKEKEEKKAQKEAKRKAQESKIMEKLMKKAPQKTGEEQG